MTTLAEQLEIDAAAVLADLPKTDSVVFQYISGEVTAANGQTSRTWATLATVSANVESRDVREDYQADRLQVSRIYSIVSAYIPGVTEKCRVVYQGKNLNISRIKADETTKRYLLVEAYADNDTYDNAFPTTTTTTTT